MKNLLPNPYLLAIGVGLFSYFILLGLKMLFSLKVSRFTGKSTNRWDDLVVFTIERTKQFFMVSTSIYLGLGFLKHGRSFDMYADRIYFVIAMWQVAVWSHSLLEKWISSILNNKMKRNPAVASSISLVQLTARLLLFSIIFLFTLSNLGIKITTIIAGLGVGGIAVALALQKILGDLFSSLSIVLDKPFVVGDFIIVDSYLGEVEKIGLKTTRVRSLSGEQIIFSNSDLLAARIRNYKRMHERRVDMILNLPLNTSLEKVRSAVSIITAIVRTQKMVRFERCHFMGIGSTLQIETIYWVLSDNYDLHMDIQQDILYDIKNAFESERIEFALPLQEIKVRPTEIIMTPRDVESSKMLALDRRSH